MDTAPWPQEIVVKPMEEIITNTAPTTTNLSNKNTKPQPSTSLERKVRPQKDQALNCPRCNSTNTKFCYYNNYSLTQPRYFCKSCRRYWTEGGSLRNIPVGGGSRKNKRIHTSSSSISSSTTSKIKLPDPNPNPKFHGSHDLNLGFPSTLSEFMQTTSASNSSHLSAMELLTGLTSSRGFMNPFMGMQIPDPNSAFPSGFSLQGDFKPTLNFALEGVQESGGIGGRNLFPFQDLKTTTTTVTTTTTTTTEDQNQNHNSNQQIARDQQGDSTGYWTGMLGGAVSW